MKNVIIKDGKIYSESFGKVDVFEIMDKIPVGFFVWNIGDNMGHDEYIPVCQDLRPGDKDCFEINTRTLKAVRLSPEEVQLLRKAAGYIATLSGIQPLFGGDYIAIYRYTGGECCHCLEEIKNCFTVVEQ